MLERKLLVPGLALSLALAACSGDSGAHRVDALAATDSPSAPTDGSVVGRDPATDGDFGVTTATVSIPGAGANRSLPATVFATDAPPPRPLVIASPGFQMRREQYASYAQHLATWGFVVVLVDYADQGFFADHAALALDTSSVVDWAQAQTALAIDGDRIAAVGHSLGGKISVFAAANDARIKAVVAWDPVDGSSPSVVPEKMADVSAAIAVVGETTNATGGGMPCAPASENFQQFYAAAKSPALSIEVVGADHMDWVDDPSCGFCGFCTPGTAAPELARTVTRRLDVAWLRRQLLGDTAMEVWLDTPPEVALGSVTISRR